MAIYKPGRGLRRNNPVSQIYPENFFQMYIWVISFSTDVARTKNHVERFSLEYSSLKKWDYQVTLYVVTFSEAGRRFRLRPNSAAHCEDTQRSAGSRLEGAAAIKSRRCGWGHGEVRDCFWSWAPPTGGLGERAAEHTKTGPARDSPTDQRPEGLQGPQVEGHNPLLAALSAGPKQIRF